MPISPNLTIFVVTTTDRQTKLIALPLAHACRVTIKCTGVQDIVLTLPADIHIHGHTDGQINSAVKCLHCKCHFEAFS